MVIDQLWERANGGNEGVPRGNEQERVQETGLGSVERPDPNEMGGGEAPEAPGVGGYGTASPSLSPLSLSSGEAARGTTSSPPHPWLCLSPLDHIVFHEQPERVVPYHQQQHGTLCLSDIDLSPRGAEQGTQAGDPH